MKPRHMRRTDTFLFELRVSFLRADTHQASVCTRPPHVLIDGHRLLQALLLPFPRLPYMSVYLC